MEPVVKFVVVVALLLPVTILTGPGVDASAIPDAAGAPAAAPAPLVARLHLAFSAMAAEGQQPGQGGGGWMMECFGAVTELRSCTNEIVLFFLNGESWLGRDCCLAIRTVTRHCWPSMLASVGFTSEEADVLRGFCDAEVAPPPCSPAAPLAPAPAVHP